MILSRIEGLNGEGTLFSFLNERGGSNEPVSDWGWQRRNATFTVAGEDFGETPYASGPAPLASRQFSWQILYSRDKQAVTFDQVMDDLNYALHTGREVLLVAEHDLGYERVVRGRAYEIQQPFTTDNQITWKTTVIWELNEFWHERRPVDNTIRAGQRDPIIKCGAKTHDAVEDGFGNPVTDSTGAAIMSTSYLYHCGQGKPTRAILAADFLIPTSIADATTAGPGGVPTQMDTTPTITIKGPLGGSKGFAVGNMTDPMHQPMIAGLDAVGFICNRPLGANEWLVLNTAAWKAELHTPNGVTNIMRQAITIPDAQPQYIMAIIPRKRNQIRVVCLGDNPVYSGSSLTLGWWRKYL